MTQKISFFSLLKQQQQKKKQGKITKIQQHGTFKIIDDLVCLTNALTCSCYCQHLLLSERHPLDFQCVAVVVMRQACFVSARMLLPHILFFILSFFQLNGKGEIKATVLLTIALEMADRQMLYHQSSSLSPRSKL